MRVKDSLAFSPEESIGRPIYSVTAKYFYSYMQIGLELDKMRADRR